MKDFGARLLCLVVLIITAPFQIVAGLGVLVYRLIFWDENDVKEHESKSNEDMKELRQWWRWMRTGDSW